MMKQRGFQLINPTEKWFPGLMEIRNNFSNWDWCYGKTPKFTVQKDLLLKSDDKDHNVQLKVSVDNVSIEHLILWNILVPWKKILIDIFFVFLEQGLIEDITLLVPSYDSIPVVSALKRKPYTEDNLNSIVMALKGVSSDNVKHAMNHSL